MPRLEYGNARGLARLERQRNTRRARLSKLAPEARQAFRCERLQCDLSRYACGLRWRRARGAEEFRRDMQSFLAALRDGTAGASNEAASCRGCEIGREHSALVPASLLNRGAR